MSAKILLVEDDIFLRDGIKEALKMVTSTPADLLAKKGKKGCVAEGADADLLVLGDGLEIESLFMRGKTAIYNGQVLMKGRFEE